MQILFVAGVGMTIGAQATVRFFLETKKHKGELTPFIRFADQFGLSDCVDCVENEKVGTIRYTVLSELESEAKTFESEAKECPSWAQSPV